MMTTTGSGEKKPLRVLFVHHGVVLGGAPVSLLHLVRSFAETDLIEAKIASHSADMRAFFSENAGVPVIPWPDPCTMFGKVLIGYAPVSNPQVYLSLLHSLRRLRRTIREQAALFRDIKPHVIHLNSSVLFTSALAAQKVGIPFVWHVREMLQGGRFSLPRLYGCLIRVLADQVICISPAEASRLGRDRAGRVEIVYNPIDLTTLDPSLYDTATEKQTLGIEPSTKVILSLGGVAVRKGAVELVEAMRWAGENVRMVFAGPPLPKGAQPNRARKWLFLEDLLRNVGLKKIYSWHYTDRVASAIASLRPGTVRFTGLVRNVGPLLAACDVLVFAGTTPHFPRPVYEAWAMKKPVIVFEMDGVSTNIKDGVDGVIVKRRTGKALGEAIRSLLADPERIKRMGEAGYAKARLRVRPEDSARRVADILEAVALRASGRQSFVCSGIEPRVQN